MRCPRRSPRPFGRHRAVFLYVPARTDDPGLAPRGCAWPLPVSSACNGATRPRAKSSICSPPTTTSSSATTAAPTPGTRSSRAARPTSSRCCRPASCGRTCRPSSATASSSTRCASSKRSARSRRPASRSAHNLVVSDHAHLIFPYHVEEERLGEADAEPGDRHHRPRHRPVLRGQGGALQRHPRRRTAAPRPPAAAAAPDRAAQEHDPACAVTHAARTFDADALCDEYLGYAQQMRPHIKDTMRLLHQALRDGQAPPVRGGPGQPARRGPRHLSVRDQLEQLDGRRLERLGRAGAEPDCGSSVSSRRTRPASAAARSRPS